MPRTDEKLVFTFPGQGSFDLRLLGHLYQSRSSLRKLFYAVDAAGSEILGAPFLPLVLGSDEEKQRRLTEYSDLDQLGIYLTNYAAAQLWLEQGVRPSLLLGHSFGELAAFAVAGIYSFEEGARIVCQRILSLRDNPGPGKMVAVAAPFSRVEAALKKFASAASISVINHPLQTVVSGPDQELSQLHDQLAQEALAMTLLKSRYPFHSSLLSAASRTFEIALRGYSFKASVYPVFVGTERRLMDAEMNLAETMARQLVTPLDFEAIVRELYAHEYRRFLECGAGTIITRIVGSVLAADEQHREWATFPVSGAVSENLRKVKAELSAVPTQAQIREQEPPAVANPAIADDTSHALQEPCDIEPLGIVAMGCVLPGGANNPDQFWQNVSAGISGIIDLGEIDPAARGDFVAGKVDGAIHQIVSDKTYTLLNGSVTEFPYDAALLGAEYSQAEYELLTKGQKILALSMAQAGRQDKSRTGRMRTQCILGSTADGYVELDDAHFGASVREILNELDAPLLEKEVFSRKLNDALPGWKRSPEELTPHKLCADVAGKVLGIAPERTYLVDSACSSSLYSLALGARALRAGEVDLVYAGGVFAPGPANNNFFAQFRGLTANQSRPFDAKADGVIFGDGAGIVAVKRLRDAIDDGDRIFGVIRAEGLSSDGKSPSINVPQSGGQALAIRAAYERAHLDPGSVQYIEAHATATPVGDAVEFKALLEAMPQNGGPSRFIGSVKALIGHTGWTSGVASVIKICKALEHHRIPKQFGYEEPNPNMGLDGSGFTIPTQECAWPRNADGLPRRAGCNGFGFGGTNAHVIIEEYVEPYHKALADRFREKRVAPQEIVVVAAEVISPDDRRRYFERGGLRMPTKRPVLPDVAEHMDASQYLAALAAERITRKFPAGILERDPRIGVALGLQSKTERGVRANERVFLDRLSRISGDAAGSLAVLKRVREAITSKVIPSGPYTLPGLMPNVAASRVTHTFNWHGPNIVIDRGKASLVQALDAGIKFVQAGDCEIALAGAVNAWVGHSQARQEAVVLVAFTSASAAEKYKLPVLAGVQFAAPSPDASRIAIDAADSSCCGASGAIEIVEAIAEVSRGSIPVALTWNGAPVLTLAPVKARQMHAPPEKKERATEARSSHAYIQGTRITNYTHVLVEAGALESRGSLAGRSYLFLADQPEAWREFEREASLGNLAHVVVTPSGVKIPGAVTIDLSREDSLREGLAQIRQRNCDTIVAVKQLSSFSREDLLLRDFNITRGLLDLLFGICRERYQDISCGRCSVATICLGALSTGELDAFTGLFGGFVKSLARELPKAACKAVITDERQLSKALEQAVAELGNSEKVVELAYRQGKRLQNVLIESSLNREGPPWVHKDSVVLATGGARGVTAVLVRRLLQTYGCTVIALGRTAPECLPETLRSLNEAEFQQYESQFYREQLAADSSKKMPDLKRLYESYRAAHDVVCMARHCRNLPGTYEYIQCDINDVSAIDRAVGDVSARYGRLDMVLHGAGVQVSKVLPRKQLADFQRVVSTKLASLGNIYQACRDRGIQNSVNFHILTSAFSYLGNDGQPDYGAANEAMNRLAAQMNLAHPNCYWSTLAWLGWAGIGMTRGTEYAALAASRGLRGVTQTEGQNIFANAMNGPPASPVNILLAQGELAFYSPEIRTQPALTQGETPKQPAENVFEWPVSLEAMPFLSDHVVRGIPTLPGSFIIAIAGDAAQRLMPGFKIAQFERTRFLRLIRAQEGRPGQLRAISKIAERQGDQVVIQVQIVLDFVHKSGRVLGKDLLHTEIYVRMAPSIRQEPRTNGHVNGLAGVRISDPYVMEGSPVRLNGAFRTMKEVVVGQTIRHAEYKLNGQSCYGSAMDYLMPNVILVDAFWRFGTVRPAEKGLSVYVPERCDAMKVFFDYMDFDADVLRRPITFHGVNPRVEGDLLHVGPIDALDADGRTLLRVEGGVCRKFGEIAGS